MLYKFFLINHLNCNVFEITTGDCFVVCRAGHLGFYEISYMWYSLFAVIVVNVVGTIVSLLTGIYHGVLFVCQTTRATN